ncbi:MAG: DUF6270 domain-containing protein [Treponema sp.]|nr:DUF6270 domain-containing protein [Treponema sp.]
MQNKVYLEKVILTDKTFDLIFSGLDFNYAWIENNNKHLPDIIELKKIARNEFIHSSDFLDSHNNVNFKLSISTEIQRLEYSFSPNIQISNTTKFKISINNNILNIFSSEKDIKESYSTTLIAKELKYNRQQRLPYESVKKPLKTLVIGTCFARSVFKSDAFFNPEYKEFFSVGYTIFHNSFISLMSEPYKDESYRKIKDLLVKDVYKYIEVEFKKDFFKILDKVKPDFIFIDNYIDATRPIIRITDDCFLTYNKYFSESIYKRKFSGLEIVYPGSKVHQELYRKSMYKFQNELKKRYLNSHVILLGGRLSKEKKDKQTGFIEIWTDKLPWITKSNLNWDIVDSIFLEENTETSYIDMRNTNWVSDIACPIIGGASPSHYESGYYREIFTHLKKLCFGENQYEL